MAGKARGVCTSAQLGATRGRARTAGKRGASTRSLFWKVCGDDQPFVEQQTDAPSCRHRHTDGRIIPFQPPLALSTARSRQRVPAVPCGVPLVHALLIGGLPVR